MMKADLSITPPQWMLGIEVSTLMKALNHDNVNARFVGGCIRNELLGQPVKDIDIACKLTPDNTIKLLTAAGIKTIPTGIKHGTITAIINGIPFEITTLRSDINTDGRHADVSYGVDWTDDAKRRDFTINALYADMDGHIYDPLGDGLNDIQNGTVRFIGDAPTRIKEDYLRILRYFRFYGRYGIGKPDAPSVSACTELAHNITALSIERIGDELTKMMGDDTAPKTFMAMHNANILDFQLFDIETMSNIIPMQNQLQCGDLNTRIYILKNTIKYFKNKSLKSFNKQIIEFEKWWKTNKNVNASLYLYGRNITIQGLLIAKSGGADINDLQIASAMSNPIPKLPITANDIMDYFKITQGPEVGKKLKQAEMIWFNSQQTLKTMDLLKKL